MFVFSIYCIFSKKFNKKRPRGKSVNCRGLTRPAAKKTRTSPRRSGYTNNTWRTSGALARGVLAVPRARAEVRRRGTARNRRRPTRGDVCGTPFLQGEYHALGTSLKVMPSFFFRASAPIPTLVGRRRPRAGGGDPPATWKRRIPGRDAGPACGRVRDRHLSRFFSFFASFFLLIFGLLILYIILVIFLLSILLDF